MADSTVSNLPPPITVSDTDIIPSVQSDGRLRRVTVALLRAGIVRGWAAFIGTFLSAANPAAALNAIGAAAKSGAGELPVIMPTGALGAPNLSTSNVGALSGNVVAFGYSYVTNVRGPAYIGARSHGAVGVHGQVATGNSCVTLLGQASDGAAFRLTGRIDNNTEAATTATSSPGEWVFSTTAIGSVTPTAAMRIRANSEVQCLGSLTSALPVKVGQYTLTTLPSAATYSGYEIDVTNATGGSKRCRSNGTVWQILNTTTTVT